jgi:hypothetical protein
MSVETMQVGAIADGHPALPSAEVVSKVLSQNSSKRSFLKNAGIPTPSSKSPSPGEEDLNPEIVAK